MKDLDKLTKIFEASKLKNYIDSLRLEGMHLNKDSTKLPQNVLTHLEKLKATHG